MKWTVVYRPAAERDLTELWLDAADQQSIADAANSIERALKADPTIVGRRLTRRLRAVVEGPLEVAFQVSEPDCLVSIWAVVLVE